MPLVSHAAGTKALGGLASLTNARLRAMGDVRSTNAVGVDAIYVNPAALAHQRFVELGASHGERIQGVNSSEAAIILPLGGMHSTSLHDFGAIGFLAGVTDFGDIDSRDITGSQTGSYDAGDKILRFGYGLPVGRWVALGANVTYFDSEIANRNATGWATSFGTKIGREKGMWALGLAVENQGDSVDYGGRSSKLPTQYRGGLSLVPIYDRLTFAAEMVKPESGDGSFKSGLEWWFIDLLSLRLGYDSEPDFGAGFSAGMGLRIHNLEVAFFPVREFRLDYGFFSAEELEAGETNALTGTHRVSISFQFGDDERLAR
jgi:hypothetical protein